AVALLPFFLWLSLLLSARVSPAAVADVGLDFVSRHGSSAAIAAVAGPAARPGPGYDGQFELFMALDPFHAVPYLDAPAYRYARPLYPMLAWAMRLGQAPPVPWPSRVVSVAAVATVTAHTVH